MHGCSTMHHLHSPSSNAERSGASNAHVQSHKKRDDAPRSDAVPKVGGATTEYAISGITAPACNMPTPHRAGQGSD
jgi:hypothetical protein